MARWNPPTRRFTRLDGYGRDLAARVDGTNPGRACFSHQNGLVAVEQYAMWARSGAKRIFVHGAAVHDKPDLAGAGPRVPHRTERATREVQRIRTRCGRR